jgi:hypothetical protein
MKKILLSLAAIFVCLSSFAGVPTTNTIDYTIKLESGKYIATFDSQYTLYYVVGDYQFTYGLSDAEKAAYIKEANEMDMPSTDDNEEDITFKKVEGGDGVWTSETATTEGKTSWSFDCSSAGKAHSFTKTLTSTSSNVISRSVEYDHHYVLYIKLLDKQNKVVDDSEQKYSVDDSSTLTGKIDLTVDENAAVEVYNLSGVRMQGDNLPAGVYIRRQGNKVSKYVVR